MCHADENGLAVFQSQNILHIVQTCFAVDPNCGADGAGGKGHAAAGFVGDFDAFAVGGEEGGVVADDVACADGGKADGGRIARAGVAFAAVNGALFEVAAECVGDDFAHAQGGAAGGVDFVAVVAFNDFDVVAFVEDAGDGVEDVEGEVDADAEVGGEDDACFSPAAWMAALPASSKPVVPMMMLTPFQRIFAGVSGSALGG